jgi:hypothetical protein
MTEERSVLVHIGMHKTASSWLKTHVFREDPFSELLPVPEVVTKIVRPQGLDYQASSVRSLLEELLEALPVDRQACIATERLSGNPHAGSYDRYVLADRLVETVPNARVLVVFRQQADMIGSLYYQYVRRGGSCKLHEYVGGPNDRKAPLFDLEVLEYDRLVAFYVDRLGADRVLALPYELFRSDAADFVSRITAFAGAPLGAGSAAPGGRRVNKRGSLAETHVRRWLNAHLIRPKASLNQRSLNWAVLRPVDRALCAAARRAPGPLDRSLRSSQQRQIAASVDGRFVESNRRLADLVDVSLEGYGYEGV